MIDLEYNKFYQGNMKEGKYNNADTNKSKN